MKNRYFLTAVVTLIFFGACKKENVAGGAAPATDPNEQADSGIPPKSDSIYGIYVLTKLPGTFSTASIYQGLAGFNKNSETLKESESGDYGVTGNESGLNVRVNNLALTYHNFGTSSGKFYRAEDGIGDGSSGLMCELQANENFPAVKQKVARPFPELSNLSFVPDSFSKSQGLVLSLKNKITGADSIYMELYGPMDIMLYKTLAGSAGSVTFSPVELAAAKTGKDNAILIVIAKNYSYKVIKNKTFVFVKHTAQSLWNIDVAP